MKPSRGYIVTPETAPSLAGSRLQDADVTRLQLSEDGVMIMHQADSDDHTELQLLRNASSVMFSTEV